jgi:hypothetical protein
VIHQLVNKSTSADSRATTMLMDLIKDIERKAGVAEPPTTPPEAAWPGPADKQVIKNMVGRIRQGILAEIAAKKAKESGDGGDVTGDAADRPPQRKTPHEAR